MLKMDVRIGQKIQIGDAVIGFVQKSGQIVSIVIDADKSVPVKKVGEESPGINLIASKGIMTA